MSYTLSDANQSAEECNCQRNTDRITEGKSMDDSGAFDDLCASSEQVVARRYSD